jgi:hypothetical protein
VRRLTLAALLAGGRLAQADALPAHAEPVASYEIRVRLDAEAKTLGGTEHLTWRNPAREPVGELWFHLYLNAFKNSESTFMRESGGELRGDQMPEAGWGFVEVKSLRGSDGIDLAPRGRFEQPDDANAADRTVWRVPLAAPVPPGGTLELDLEFEAKLPRVFARTGYFRDYFLAGQWFPKLAVYEPAGERGRTLGGWNCHQFHANSEFYADFGRYHVEITLPRSYVVGATGVRTARRDNADGSVTHVFDQDDVIDFAWAASPRFVEVVQRFSGRRDVSEQEYAEAAQLLGRRRDEVQLGDVDIILLLQPEHLPQRERHLRAAKAAIKWFGLWYGRYPYPTITIVDPAFGAGGSGGMEYPTFITAGTSVLLNHWPLDGVLAPEEVVVHEFGHQYWQSMVATNEFEEAWLDEGFDSYSTGKVMDRVYGPWLVQALGLRLGGLELSEAENSAERRFDKMRTPAWEFSSTGNYGFNSYSRTELTLRTLEALVGSQTLARAMRTYHERFRFKHPSSDDFYAVASEVAGRELTGFFEQTVERPGILDDEVASVTSAEAEEPQGVFGEGAAQRTVTREEARRKEPQDAGRHVFRTSVLVRRRGQVVMPTSLRLDYEGGESQTLPLIEWETRFKRIRLTSAHRLVAATLDPDDRLKIDVNRLNNARRVEPRHAAANRWGTRLVFWFQQLVALAGL